MVRTTIESFIIIFYCNAYVTMKINFDDENAFILFYTIAGVIVESKNILFSVFFCCMIFKNTTWTKTNYSWFQYSIQKKIKVS